MPQQRITLSQRIFYAGLLLMLATGILSTTLPAQDYVVIPLLMAGGALLAFSARIWQHYLHRSTRKHGCMIDLSGQAFKLHSTARFASRRRSAA